MPYKDPEKRREHHTRYMRERRAVDPVFKAKHKEIVRARVQKMKEWFAEVKSGLHCLKCGETHVGCLEFHHRDATDKDFELANAVHRGWSREHILAEAAKCDILCANCHRKLHWEQSLIEAELA